MSLTFSWCLHSFKTDFTNYSVVFIVDFQQVNARWNEVLTIVIRSMAKRLNPLHPVRVNGKIKLSLEKSHDRNSNQFVCLHKIHFKSVRVWSGQNDFFVLILILEISFGIKYTFLRYERNICIGSKVKFLES